MERIRQHVTPANVISVCALLVALGGSAVATRDGGQEADGRPSAALPARSVTAAALAPGAVTATKIAPGAVTATKLAPRAVGSTRLARRAVTAAAIAPGAVQTAAIAPGAVQTAAIAPGAVTPDRIAPASLTASLFAANQLPTGLNADKITIVRGGDFAIAPNTLAVTTAAGCPPGQKVIGGGFDLGTVAYLNSSAPAPDGNGWELNAGNGDTGTNATVRAIAICAAP